MRRIGMAVVLGLGLILGSNLTAQANDAQRLFETIIGVQRMIERGQNRPRRERTPHYESETQQPRQTLDSNQIYAMQQRLNELGYDVGNPDGQMGSRTRRAIVRYQQSNGLATTGQLSQEDYRTLVGGSNAQAEESLSTQEMVEMQRALQRLGYDVGKPDGQAGTKTGRAISAFLRERGLDPYQVPVQEAHRLVLAATASAGETGSAAVTLGPAETSTSPVVAGLPMKNGAIQLATTVNHALQVRVSGGDADGYARKLDDFGRLLILAGAPHFLDDAEKTEFFLPLIELKRLRPYISDNVFDLTQKFGIGHLDGWRGDNQFQQEDSRQAFLRQFRDELLSLAPKLPLRIDIVRSIGFGKYDGKTLELDIDHHSVFPHFSSVGLDPVEPFTNPTQWDMDAVMARRLVEAQTASLAQDSYDRPVVVTRAEISGLRATDTGVVVEIAAIDITAYANSRSAEPLGQLPMPPNAVVKQGDDAKPSGELAVSPFDPVLLRMLAAGERSDLASNVDFQAESFRMRRAAETRLRNARRGPAVDWGRVIPISLTTSSEAPTASEIQAFTQWFDNTRSMLSQTARLHGFCWFRELDDKVCELPHSAAQPDGTIALTSFMSGSMDWDYSWNGIPDGAAEVAKAAYPTGQAFVPFGAGRDLPGYIVLKSHPAWYGLKFDGGPLQDASLDVRIVSRKLLNLGGAKVLAVEIEPTALRYLRDGQWNAIDIQPHEKNLSSGATGTMDVLGAKIGMPLEVAKELIAKSFEGREAWSGQENKLTGNDLVLGPTDPIFGTVFAFRSPRWATDSFPDMNGAEAIRLFYDQLLPEKPVIAIDRSVRFGKSLHSNEEQRQAGAPVLDALIEKYGSPDRKADLGDQYGASLWAADSAAKARIKTGDDYCELDSWLSTTYYNGSPSNSGQVKNDCGELLSVWIRAGIVSQMLIDTSAVLRLRQHYLSELEAKKAKETAAKPAIKF